jgi:hypothetical protein
MGRQGCSQSVHCQMEGLILFNPIAIEGAYSVRGLESSRCLRVLPDNKTTLA